MNTISFVIDVIPRTKKNSNRIVKIGNKRKVISSKQYEEFEKECIYKLDNKLKQLCIEEPINIRAVFYMDTKRRVDITNLLNALDDMLVKAGVIKDDNRNIVASHDGSLVLYDKERPRIEIGIKPLFGYNVW